jgi:hypothetical protein
MAILLVGKKGLNLAKKWNIIRFFTALWHWLNNFKRDKLQDGQDI